MKILSNKKYNELILKSCKGMFGAVNDDMLLRENALLNKENKQLKERIDKAIKYINTTYLFDISEPLELLQMEHYDKLLEILGDKE